MCKIFKNLLFGFLILANGGEGAFLNISGQEALLMAGGVSGTGNYVNLLTVEVFIPSTGESYFIKNLSMGRYSHTMDGGHLCGSAWIDDPIVMTTCMEYSPADDQWTTSYTLEEKRTGHTSWLTDQGLLLMGGWYSDTTTEIVPVHGGQGGPSFDMKHRTKYSCSIPDLTSDTVILTGGGFDAHLVQRYDMQGHVEDLPQLVEGRMDHGCGAYIRGDGTQVLLVAGGMLPTGMYTLTTEILVGNSRSWTTVSPLPLPSSGRYGLGGIQSARLGNTLYMTGGYDGFYSDNKILEWKDDREEWMEVGRMKNARNVHSMTTIKIEGKIIENFV